MRVSGQIKEASLEQLTADPTNTPEGRIWQNTTSKDFKVILNNIVRKVFTSADQISSANIANGAITTTKIGDGQVTPEKIATSGVATDNIADNAVSTVKIANGAITAAKRAALNIQKSALVTQSISGGGSGDVTGMNISITTSGRPVQIFLMHGPSSSLNSSTSSGNLVSVQLCRGSTVLSDFKLNMSIAGDTYIQASSIMTVDEVAAGTYTYKLTYSTQPSTTLSFTNVRIVAIEL